MPLNALLHATNKNETIDFNRHCWVPWMDGYAVWLQISHKLRVLKSVPQTLKWSVFLLLVISYCISPSALMVVGAQFFLRYCVSAIIVVILHPWNPHGLHGNYIKGVYCALFWRSEMSQFQTSSDLATIDAYGIWVFRCLYTNSKDVIFVLCTQGWYRLRWYLVWVCMSGVLLILAWVSRCLF